MFVRVSGRLRVNLASLNAQGTAGNVIELAKAHLVLESSGRAELVEVPVVTGNALKHWHFVHFVEAYMQLGGQMLCDYCRRFIGFRSQDKEGKSEEYFVKRCAGEDVHGFLQPDNQVRRDSLVKAAFIVPVEGAESRIDTLTHNRVVVNEQGVIEGRKGEGQAMMVFKRQYASALYGFQVNLDLGYVGRLQFAMDRRHVVDGDEINKRTKAALIALLPLFSGQLGASRSRAEPVWKVEELIAAWCNHPLPSLTHGHYSDYFLESVRTLKVFSNLTHKTVKAYVYGVPEELVKQAETVVGSGSSQGQLKLSRVGSWQEIIEKLVHDYESQGCGSHS